MSGDTYIVERSINIDAPPEAVFELIANFHHWTTWSPWEGLDPAMSRTYSGAQSGLGASYAWSGNRKAGRGQMEIIDAVAPSRIEIALSFEKPFKSHSDTMFDIQQDGSGSRITWTMTGKQTRMTKAMGMFTSMDKMVGPDFEKGLARLKEAAEQSAVS